MTTLREAAQQALEALEDAEAGHAAQILRAALAESERDWSLLEATQESLREHMAEIQRLRGLLAEPQKPAIQCTYPLCKTTAGCSGVCSKAAPQPKAEPQEPVAYMHCPSLAMDGKVRPVLSFEKYEGDYASGIYAVRIPLYAAPQPRKRLTDQEIARMASGLEGCDGLPVNATKANWRKVFDFARAIEAAVWGDGK